MKLHCLLPYLLVCIATILQLSIIPIHGRCLEDQKVLLLQLKQSLAFDSARSTKLVTWNESIDCCAWPGVSCSDGQVRGLNLSNESISGGLDDSNGLFGLQYLQKLDLSSNIFNTPIPAGIAKLTHITHLNLSDAYFWGQIPIEISYLARLVCLDLSFSGLLYLFDVPLLKLENPNLENLVQNLTQLKELYLDGVNISAQGNEWSKALSSSLPNLQVLSLSNCLLAGPIDYSLAQLHYLSAINLRNNKFYSSVPEFFSNFRNLTALNLRYCELGGAFPREIFLLPRLQNLDLSNNPSLEGSLPDSFVNSSLTTLVLSETNFSGRIPDSVGNLGSLSRIELYHCKFSGPIPSSLARLTQLVHLDFSYNAFTRSIPPFHTSKALAHMDFSHNQLTGEISSVHWDALMTLSYLDLRHNSLSGGIPSSLFASSSLQNIQLSFNNLEGPLPEVSNPTSSPLKALDLSSNKLEGYIPKSVFNLKCLNVLSLSFNKFFGDIKLDWIQKLGNITTLDLSYNKLIVHTRSSSSSSSFPQVTTLKLAACNLTEFPDLRNQRELFYLDLSANHINEIVHRWVWEIGNGSLVHLNLSHNLFVGIEGHPSHEFLSTLDLGYNQLKGNLPSLPSSITYVDFSNNNFNSSIPPEIGNYLQATFFLSFSNNRLTGIIPQSICSASYLQVLDLSHNYLNGNLPACLVNMTERLAVLNLRRNKFDGIIPDKFPINCSLKTLDLSDNHLEGKIPKSLSHCYTLEVLDLSNNHINDEFPCLLKNMSSLQVLVLRNNSFHGYIGCPTQDDGWSGLQIIDIASNNFRGNLPESLLATWLAMEVAGNGTCDSLRYKPLELTELYYQDSIVVTNKGLRAVLVKILATFKLIDFSCNKIEGPIPEVIGKFNAVHLLNLSHNAFTGQIPPSFGGMSLLESLDLSFNRLSGAIPQQLASLTFLAILNLSYNQLTGVIPTGSQLQTFDEYSFGGNDRLCGAPLKDNCSRDHESIPEEDHSRSGRDVNWVYVSAEVGFVFGFGIVVGPLLLWRRWRIWYYKHVDRILFRVFPRLEERSWNYRTRVGRNRNRRKQQLQR